MGRITGLMANAILMHALINANHDGGLNIVASAYLSNGREYNMTKSWDVLYVVFPYCDLGSEHIILFNSATLSANGYVVCSGYSTKNNYAVGLYIYDRSKPYGSFYTQARNEYDRVGLTFYK